MRAFGIIGGGAALAFAGGAAGLQLLAPAAAAAVGLGGLGNFKFKLLKII